HRRLARARIRQLLVGPILADGFRVDHSHGQCSVVPFLVPAAHWPYSERAHRRNQGAPARVDSRRGGPSVIQIVAVFDRRDALLRAMAAAKTHEIRIVTAFSPAFDAEIVAAADAAASAVSLWTLVGGIAGAIGGLALPVWTVGQWPTLIVGGKPLVALPPFLIIAFASTILVAVCAAFIGFVV